MIKSLPYHPFKISHLKDPIYSAGYITLLLNEQEEGDLELGILISALRDVFEALGEPNMSAEDAKLHLEQLDNLLSNKGSETIYALANWLKALGLKLTVSVAEAEQVEGENIQIVAELAEVGNI